MVPAAVPPASARATSLAVTPRAAIQCARIWRRRVVERTVAFRLLAAALALTAAAQAHSGPEWVTLDPDILGREGDRSSIEHQGPWAQFTQRWGAVKDGKPNKDAIIERMAVNCLTGAYGQTQYPSTDLKTNRPVLKEETLSEVEHAQQDDGRLLLSDNSTALGRALIGLACTCPGHAVGAAPTEQEIRWNYDRYIAEPMSKVEFHLRFIRVKSKELALAAIAKLRSGRSFESVFDEYASAFDVRTFPHGDLGPHLETEFPIAEVRLYRQLKVGEFSQVPYEGTSGWEIDKLESKRTIPAPPLNTMRSRLIEYLMRARSCGWAS
jgi:hypothetical protein